MVCIYRLFLLESMRLLNNLSLEAMEISDFCLLQKKLEGSFPGLLM